MTFFYMDKAILSAYGAFKFNKVTDEQTYIKHDLNRMMLAWYMKVETNKQLQSGGYKQKHRDDC